VKRAILLAILMMSTAAAAQAPVPAKKAEKPAKPAGTPAARPAEAAAKPATEATAKPAAPKPAVPSAPKPAAAEPLPIEATSPIAAAAPPPTMPRAIVTLPPAPYTPDLGVLQLQVVLDRLGFAPGVIDGRGGKSLVLAIKGYQAANGLEATGTLGPETKAMLAQFKDVPAIETLTLGAADLLGTFVGPLPHGYDLQAQLPCLCYADPAEMLGERYHSTAAALAALNPGVRLVVGAKLKVPAVGTLAHGYPAYLPSYWQGTLIGLNVAAEQPKADHVVVSKGAGSLQVLDAAGKLVAQFPVTTGSEHDPLPIGTWTIKGAAYDPVFHYNPALFWDAKKGDKRQTLPPGPNGPVGVVWLDLSKQHYGIHGTPRPETIGRAESHGCIRMANWDVARLALMVHAGTPAIFEP